MLTRKDWDQRHTAIQLVSALRREGRMSERQARLFAVACCRRIEPLVRLTRGAWGLVITAEALADNMPTRGDVAAGREFLAANRHHRHEGEKSREHSVRIYALKAALAAVSDTARYPIRYEHGSGVPMPEALLFELHETATFTAMCIAKWAQREPQGLFDDNVYFGASIELSAILRDIVGDPFRPAAWSQRWATSDAIGIARACYESRDFAALPVLADALEEAGCDSDAVLSHCRGPGPHVRGCWVVDRVLGKT